MLNKLLLRQIREHFGEGDEIPEEYREFLLAISDSYNRYQEDQKILGSFTESGSEETVGFHHSHSDIAQKFRALEILRQSQQRYQVFISQRPEGVWRFESKVPIPVYLPADRQVELMYKHGYIAESNDAIAVMCGYAAAAEMEGASLGDLVRDSPENRAYLRAFVHSGHQVRKYETCETDGYGKSRYFLKSLHGVIENECLVRAWGIQHDITEAKVAEEKLKGSEAHLKASQHIAKTGSWEIDLDHKKGLIKDSLQWTDETYRIFGYEPGEIVVDYDSFFRHIHPEDQGRMNSLIRRAFIQHIYSAEHRIIRKDGSGSTVYVRGEFAPDPASGGYKIVGTIQDVTERNQTITDLKNAEANLRNILENTDTAYVLLDTRANILSFNHPASDLAGAESGIALKEGINYIDVLPEVRKQPVKEAIDQVLESGRQLTYEINYRQTDGTDRWLSVRMHPITDKSKKALGLSVAADDITERKKTVQRLKESNNRYELVIRATNDVIWDWDIVNDTMYRSDNFEILFGYQGGEDPAFTRFGLAELHEKDRDRIAASISRQLQQNNSTLWEGNYRFYRKNGEIAYVNDRGYLIFNEKNEPVRMVGAMRDVTNERRYEIEREKITADLVQRNRNLEQFAYIVSHNLRAPVANIIGLADLITSGALEKETFRECVQGLSFSVNKLDQIITDLNSILQIGREVSERKERVFFSEIMENVREKITDIIEREKVKISSDFSEVNEFHSIKSYLFSIFFNLISNSIKYRKPEGTSQIRIYSRKSEDKVILVFEDNGLGIDLDKYGDKMFGLYKRFHFAIDGKGMGLFMVKAQVESMEGSIAVKSELNKGAQFIITLPEPRSDKFNKVL